MSRASSPRAAARALYRAAAAQAVSDSAAAAGAADAPPPTETAAAAPPPLTDRGRALYEDGVVPVREIARLVGVSERTFYHYVRRGGWQRRYRWSSRGAGGRVVRSIESGDPHACALEALDRDEAARALRRCDAAAALARDAQAAAAAEAAQRRAAASAARAARLARRREREESRAIDAQIRLLELLGAALVDLAKGYRKGGARYAALAGELQTLIAAEMRAALRRQCLIRPD